MQNNKTAMKEEKQKRKRVYLRGLRDGFPIGAGYFAVSFAVGITAKNAGLTVCAATVMSLLNLTSAGQAAAISLIAVGTTAAELALTQLVINARYFLMSCALSARLAPQTSFFHRFLVAFGVTDEIFGIASAYPGQLSPYYCYGAMSAAIPGWCAGTALGVLFGNVLPALVVDALSVALYGMFIAIIVPNTRKNRAVAVLVVCSMAASWLMSILPVIRTVSPGFRIIIITICAAGAAAVLCPVPADGNR